MVDEQRYLIWKHCHEQSEAFQIKQKRIQEEANRKRAEAMQGVSYAPKGEHRKPEKVGEHCVPAPSTYKPGKTAKAAAAKVNKGAVARGDKLAKERPDLAEKVRKGEMKPAEAHVKTIRYCLCKRCAKKGIGHHEVMGDILQEGL